jgi:hypothetical protein
MTHATEDPKDVRTKTRIRVLGCVRGQQKYVKGTCLEKNVYVRPKTYVYVFWGCLRGHATADRRYVPHGCTQILIIICEYLCTLAHIGTFSSLRASVAYFSICQRHIIIHIQYPRGEQW